MGVGIGEDRKGDFVCEKKKNNRKYTPIKKQRPAINFNLI